SMVQAAQAAGTAVVAVDGCQAGATAAATEQLREALGRGEGSGVLSAEETANRLGGAPHGTLADSERMLASARFDVLDQSAFDRAERTLLFALDDLRALPPSDAKAQDL